MPDSPLLPRPLESALFAVPVYAATTNSAFDVSRVVEAGRLLSDGLIVVRAPAAATHTIHELERHGGLLCDVLQTFTKQVSCDPDAVAVHHGGFKTRIASGADSEALYALGHAAFADFKGHWHADSRLPTHLADLLYARWSANLARDETGATKVLMAEKSGSVIGFLALERSGEARWRVPLTCVAPRNRGLGILKAMIDIACADLARSSGGRIDYETQITNEAALRAVSRSGFEPGSARLTFHLWVGGE